MDARLSPEQRELREAAAKLADDLGPGSVREIEDQHHHRTERLEAAVAASGFRSLRSDGAGGVEVALVAEEFARALVDVPFVGPALADAFPAAGSGPVPASDVLALAGQRTGAHGTVDLTGAVALPLDFRPEGSVASDAATRWQALAIVLTAADLLGAARGAHALALDYVKVRAQYGKTIGSYQAVSHPLAEGLALLEGMTSILRRAAWAVDAETPEGALRLARVAKLYCARSARTVCETAIQVHGGIGNTWECLAHVYLRRVLTATELFPVRIEEVA